MEKNRIKRDNADFKMIELFFEVHNPFDPEEPDLRNIFTGLTAKTDDQINCNQTEDIGKVVNEKLDGISFCNSSIKQKEQIKSLEELKVGVKLDKETIYVDPSVLFSRLLLMIEREQRMIEYFRHELTPVPTSPFEDGMMRKSAKSVLMKAVTKNVPRDASYVSPVGILDGGALRKIKWIINSTIHNVVLQYSQYIKFKYGLCCVAFGGYDEKPSIKDHEHQRCSRNASSYIKVDLHNQISCSQKAFLKNSKNKPKLFNYLNYLANDGHDIRNSKGDADTLIVSTAIQYTKKQDNEVVVVANDTDILVLVVVANDTDILVLPIYHWQKSMKLFIHSEVTKKNACEKQIWKIEEVVLALGNEIAIHFIYPCVDWL